jgi:ATP-dependent Clp protease ATP-binding subunit ClpC
MFERFTEGAREVVVLAQEEARALRHEYIGAEHMLLGLTRLDGRASSALQTAGVTSDRARERVVAIVGTGEGTPSGQIPFTPAAKSLLEGALREAMRLRHSHLGEEHLLLALLHEREGVAADVLTGCGVDSAELSREVLEAVKRSPPDPPPYGSPGPHLAFSAEMQRVLGVAEELAREQGDREIGPSHLRRALEQEGESRP